MSLVSLWGKVGNGGDGRRPCGRTGQGSINWCLDEPWSRVSQPPAALGKVGGGGGSGKKEVFLVSLRAKGGRLMGGEEREWWESVSDICVRGRG